MAKEFTLDLCVQKQDQIKLLVKDDSPIAHEVIDQAFFQTKQSRSITKLYFKRNRFRSFETFRATTTLLDKHDIQAKISKGKQKEGDINFVRLKILSLRWLLQDDKWFGDLVSLFKEIGRENWFGNEVMQVLFQSYWPEIQRCIILRGLIPFIVYFLSTFIFNYYSVYSSYNQIGHKMTKEIFWTVGPVMFFSWLYFTYMEILQINAAYQKVKEQDEESEKNDKHPSGNRICRTIVLYYSRIWNFLDTFLIFSLVCLTATETYKLYFDGFKYYEPTSTWKFYWILSVQSCMWYKLFDWLRLFKSTAIYPVLLIEVLIDIAPYGLMMLIIFGLFGNGWFIL